jgi:hypothetical protein
MKATFVPAVSSAMLALLLATTALGQNQQISDFKATVREDAKSVGHAFAESARTVGHTVGDKSREAGHAVAATTKSAGQAIRDDSKKAGHAVADGARSVGKSAAEAADKTKAAVTGKPSGPAPKS